MDMIAKLWIAAAMISTAAPLRAQPVIPSQKAGLDTMTAGELERVIGGRTTLELKFNDATSEDVTNTLAKSSGLAFVSPLPAFLDEKLREAPVWDGNVEKSDFWLALRQWGRAENLRLKRGRETIQQRQKTELPPSYPKPAAGETAIASALLAEFEKNMTAWSRRRTSELQEFDLNRPWSASFDGSARAWRLTPSSDLISGRAVNVWPCLVLASKFQRQQSLSAGRKSNPNRKPERPSEWRQDKSRFQRAGQR